MDNKATATLFLDTRRIKKDNTYPVKLTVYFDREKKRYSTGINITEEDWNKLHVSNMRDDRLKLLKRRLFNKKEKAEALIDKLTPFSFLAFEEAFFEEKRVRRSSKLEDIFDEYIEDLKRKGQVGTAISYNTTKNSLQQFKSSLKIADITTKFLEEYERHMQSKSISPSTIGIYLRQLRRIVNVAIQKGLLPIEKYPFKGFTIPSSRNIKKALAAEQVKLLLNYATDDLQLRRALDFWLFSYLSNGINMTDVCHLKPENIQGEFFYYYRAKTKNTKKRDLRPIKVPLTARSLSIIERWKNTDHQNPYLFPILKEGLTPLQMKYKIQDFIWKTNKSMKVVAESLGIEQKVGTYVARHSHSTILKRKGAPTEVIKENLGHSSVLVTENYLDDFTDDVKKDYARMLTDL